MRAFDLIVQNQRAMARRRASRRAFFSSVVRQRATRARCRDADAGAMDASVDAGDFDGVGARFGARGASRGGGMDDDAFARDFQAFCKSEENAPLMRASPIPLPSYIV